jgi:kinesin family protein 6/9
LQEREQKIAAKERQELEIRMAIKIQSWWRMTMVRKKLGPYRKKKKPTTTNEQAKKPLRR